jgi:hypothetical protein
MEWTGKWVQGQKMAMYQMVVVDLRLLPHHCDSMKTPHEYVNGVTSHHVLFQHYTTSFPILQKQNDIGWL